MKPASISGPQSEKNSEISARSGGTWAICALLGTKSAQGVSDGLLRCLGNLRGGCTGGCSNPLAEPKGPKLGLLGCEMRVHSSNQWLALQIMRYYISNISGCWSGPRKAAGGRSRIGR